MFYVNPEHPSDQCQNCDGSHDPSAQAKQDADRIAQVNTARVAGRRQTVDLRTLQEAQAAAATAASDAVAEATQSTRGRRSNA
jgi:hypothetical protein